MKQNYENQWTMITGACGGLGKAFCKELAKKNSNLFITGTNEEKTKAWADELKANFRNIKVEFAVCDLRLPASRSALFTVLKEKNIAPNRLINNAGYILEGGLLDHSEQTILDVIKTNCEGTIDITQKFVRNFGDNTEILTVSSLGAFYPMPYMSAYSSSKSFLLNFMVALRVELKNKNIKVSTLCPGGIPTTKEMKDAIKAQGLGGKLSTKSPEYIATYALKKLNKNKAIIVPGAFNRFLKFLNRFASLPFVAKVVAKRWEKANKKREK